MDVIKAIEDKIIEIDHTFERLIEAHGDSNMVTVNKKVLAEYLAMAKKYCTKRLNEEKLKNEQSV